MLDFGEGEGGWGGFALGVGVNARMGVGWAFGWEDGYGTERRLGERVYLE